MGTDTKEGWVLIQGTGGGRTDTREGGWGLIRG